MALKIKLAHPATTNPRYSGSILPGQAGFGRTDPAGRPSSGLSRLALKLLLVFVVLFLIAAGSFYAFYYFKYKHIVDERLQHPLFINTAKIYAAPREVRVGQKLTSHFVAEELHQAGYSPDGGSRVSEGSGQASPMGTYRLDASSIYVRPGRESYHAQDGATISFDGPAVSQITGDGGQQLAAYELEPQLITGLSEEANRTKRRLVKYDELPPMLVKAVTSIEDRRFFSHGGVDYIRLLGAVRNDLSHRHNYMEGGSTLTMQLARGFFLTPEKKLKRKFIEIVITFQLESRFSKQEIFEMYANQINLGQQGSFAINGFGEAAQVYFGRDVRRLDLAQCALLAGMVQQPSYRNPYRHPERAVERRNVVLDAMAATGNITPEEAQRARAEPLKLASQNVDAGEAPYFVDLVRDQLNQKIGERDFNREGLRIYTSLDPDLERVASEAVEIGMKNVDEQVRKLEARRAKAAGAEPGKNVTYPQVALVALNPHTGQVLALVGGRNYGQSQLNHTTAKRPTGSIFKPFVYAAAFNTAIAGSPLPGQDAVFSPVTMLSDEQATYNVGNQEYTPRNFHGEYHNQVTARYALQYSLNNATIALAQMVGFNNVASLAREAGIKSARGTPTVAIGAYDATPLDMSGAYTVFANGGVKIDPWMVASVRSPDGGVLNDYSPDSKPLLDPRVAYLTTSLMENVINAGTGNEVRRRGFTAPAAGKTGTSHDAWFAGYTSNLLCIVWVGNDDYTDIKLEGAHAAAPIWAEFMKRAVQLPQYSDTRAFVPPAGIVEVKIDKASNLLTDPTCPEGYFAAFLEGTAPTDTCDHANGDQRNLFQKLFGLGDKPADGTVLAGTPTPAEPSNDPALAEPAAADTSGPAPRKKGFFGRVLGALKGDDKTKTAAPPPPAQAPPAKSQP